METVSIIRLILKDVRVVTIDLRRSQNANILANQILYFSKSGPIEKMTQVGAAMEERGVKAKSRHWIISIGGWEGREESSRKSEYLINIRPFD